MPTNPLTVIVNPPDAHVPASIADREGDTALPCPKCGSGTGVLDSRPLGGVEGSGRRRRRCCVRCGHRFRTIEVPYDEVVSTVQNLTHVKVALGNLESAALLIAKAVQALSGDRERDEP